MSDFLARVAGNLSRKSSDLDGLIRNGMGGSASGISVTPDSAMRIAAVYASVRVLAESVAQLPLILYRRLPNGGKERAMDHPLSYLLHDAPNSYQTSFEWREMLQGHLALRGNAFAYINRVGKEVRELLPLHPGNVSVKQDDNWNLTYTAQMKSGSSSDYRQDRILHLRGLSSDGIVGLSPVQLFREAMGLSLATERHGAKMFSNGARIGGLLKHPGKLSDDGAKRLKDSFEATYGGVENAYKTALLEEGLTWEHVGMTNEDAQFLDTRKFQRSEIASIFRVPPHMIGDLDKATFSNIEQQSLEFVMFSLAPWLKRWETALNKSLLRPEERQEFFFEFLVEGLLRGDFKTRVEGYASGLQQGWLCPNEVRERENLNPIKGGDEYLRPLNLTPVGQPPEKKQNEV